ncbi:YcnI family protein [Rhodoplanes azumiensis]|uniref:YcnI family protein n=1 Tax=Rhodoplanes azumiensis TaxID=1897628 RepID=A0ABW5AFP9_9BRAD
MSKTAMPTIARKTRAATMALCLITIAPAAAHVTLERGEASPGAGYKAVLRVPHGCDRSATLKIRVTIPEGLIAVKPMPKPGWTLAVTKGPYQKAYDFMHGLTVQEGVREIVWTGRLADEHYDEFVFAGFVASAMTPGITLAVPVVQECETGTAAWTEVAAPGQDPHALKTPAPLLRIVAPPEHHGHH